jgi:universal stress protein E
MRPIRRILVAVKDVRAGQQPALIKAAQLARGFDAELEIFHAIDDPLCVDVLQLGDLNLDRTERLQRSRYLSHLEALAEPLREAGLRVSTAADWDFPAYQSVVRRATRIGADLIVAERHATRHVAPWILRFNDWELLRLSPVPVLLVKNTAAYARPRILAAVDPSHAFDKPARLDVEILRLAESFGKTLRGSVHAVHAYVPTLAGMSRDDLSASDATARIRRKSERRARQAMTDLLHKASVRPAARHVLAYHACDAIPSVARKIDCSIVVMGALSRSGLKRLLVGNTAERVADDLPCDLLIVKPLGFRNRVARARRGPHLIALAALPQAI